MLIMNGRRLCVAFLPALAIVSAVFFLKQEARLYPPLGG